jgi:putative FmdB family regulatory protein
MYEYQCAACQAVFDELVRTPRDEQHLKCPRCGGTQVARKLSTFAAHAGPTTKSSGQPGPCGSCCNPDGACPWSQS